jgi:transposase
MEEFGEFPDIAVEYTQFRQTLNISLKNFQENGSVGRKPGSGRPKKRTPEVIEEARQAMEEAPGTSIEHLSQQLGVSVGRYLSFNCEK